MENKAELTGWDYSFTVAFTRNLTQEEQNFVEKCVGYSNSKNIRGEEASTRWYSHGYGVENFQSSVEVHIDTTKSPRDDIGDGFADFWNDVLTYLEEGSPIRKRTNDQLFVNPFSIDMGTLIESVESDDENVNEQMLNKLQSTQIRQIEKTDSTHFVDGNVLINGKTYRVEDIESQVKPVPVIVYGGIYQENFGDKNKIILVKMNEEEVGVLNSSFRLMFSLKLNNIALDAYNYVGKVQV